MRFTCPQQSPRQAIRSFFTYQHMCLIYVQYVEKLLINLRSCIMLFIRVPMLLCARHVPQAAMVAWYQARTR